MLENGAVARRDDEWEAATVRRRDNLVEGGGGRMWILKGVEVKENGKNGEARIVR